MDVEFTSDDVPVAAFSEENLQPPSYNRFDGSQNFSSTAPKPFQQSFKRPASSCPNISGNKKKKVGATGGSSVLTINPNKSPIQQLNEIRHGLQYVIASQTGPIHAPIFTMQVTIDGKTYEGVGHNKKAAKMQCAQNALNALVELSKQGINIRRYDHQSTQNQYGSPLASPIVTLTSSTTAPITNTSSSESNSGGINVPVPESSKQFNSADLLLPNQTTEVKNPASILNEIRKDLEYSQAVEIGLPPNRTFKVTVVVDGTVYEGVGRNKKLAKARAAQNALTSIWNLKFNQPADEMSCPELIVTDEAFEEVKLAPEIIKRIRQPIVRNSQSETLQTGSYTPVSTVLGESKNEVQILYEHFGPAYGHPIDIIYQSVSGSGKNFGKATVCIVTVEGKKYEGAGATKPEAKKKALQCTIESLKQSGEWFRRAHKVREDRKMRKEKARKKMISKCNTKSISNEPGYYKWLNHKLKLKRAAKVTVAQPQNATGILHEKFRNELDFQFKTSITSKIHEVVLYLCSGEFVGRGKSRKEAKNVACETAMMKIGIELPSNMVRANTSIHLEAKNNNNPTERLMSALKTGFE